jgi:cytochrome c biogenesis protein CcmG/thiol:disulfide interchange protein DsbE
MAALALSLLAGACAGQAEPQSTGPTGPITSPSEATLLPSTATALPEFTPERFQALLEQLRGRPVVVNFWGSWCGPCYREAPVIAAAAQAYGDRVQFIGVNITDQRGPAREFIAEFGWTFPSVYDSDNEILASLDLLGAPVTIVYDRAGEVAFEWIGEITEDQLTEALNSVLKS